MKKLLVTLALLGLFIGGTNIKKGYDFFIINIDNTAIGVLMKDGLKIATLEGEALAKFYERVLKDKQEEVRKELGSLKGTEI